MTTADMGLDDAARDALLAAAVDAGRVVMRHRAAGVVAERKADESLVSVADREAEAVILDALARIAPGTVVVAEEEASAGRQPAPCARFFLVDALDGTKEYLGGGEDFTVNIALIDAGVPVFGIVHAPASDSIHWGIAAGGAWRASVGGDGTIAAPVRIGCTTCTAQPRAVASKSHATPATDAYLLARGAKERLSIGSSLKFLLLAEGRADLYPRAGPTMEWDTAAGDAVLRAAGGMTFDLDGAPLLYGKPAFFNPGFVATGGAVEQPLGPYYPDRQTAPGPRP